jgi:hypothetical protein
MVCGLFYSSECIKGCDIAKFGEGCEQCIPLFKSSWMIVIFAVGICCLASLIIAITYSVIYRNRSFPADEIQLLDSVYSQGEAQ